MMTKFCFIMAFSLTFVLNGIPSASAADHSPTFANVSYGPHTNQLLDVYLPPGDGPFGVLVCYGAIWVPKKSVPGHGFDVLFPKQIAMVAVQTRSMTLAVSEKASPPISYVLSDARRALKFIQHHAGEWKLDVNRIGTFGGSQATIPSFYAALTACKADAASADPVERESVKVKAIAFMRGPGSIDPKRLMEWNPGVEWGAPAWGGTVADTLKRYDELHPVISKWSPEYFVTKETPPMFIENEWGLTKPDDPKITQANYQTHSPLWGIGLKKYVEKFGVICYQKYLGHPSEKYQDIWDFMVKRLQAAPK